MAVKKLTTKSGRIVEYVDDLIGQGGMKDVYMSPDRSYVVAFFRDKVDPVGQERLQDIVNTYGPRIFDGEGGDYWRGTFCWPSDLVVDDKGRTGVVVPTYDSNYFFKVGSVNGDILNIRGQEKEGKWFASAKMRSRYLPAEEKGSWRSHLQMCLSIARGVRRLHAAGLAHSDLSYRNVLVDPTGERGTACIIDIDGLVVPGKFPPDVVGTPDFIAPEVIGTQGLALTDPARKLPSTATDRHALAVLIYMYLLYRHPLDGGRVLDADPTVDTELSMGAKALFVENPTDFSNRVNVAGLDAATLPWADPDAMPHTIVGPLLSKLFQEAFVDGLHNPQARPTAAAWEDALITTLDMIQPCANTKCEMQWYVFDNSTSPRCPLCKTPYAGQLPILNLYSSRQAGTFRPDNHRIMVWDGQSLYPWHINRLIYPNEKLDPALRKRVGYFQKHGGVWYMVNEAMPGLTDATTKELIPIGGKVALVDDLKLLFSAEEGARLAHVQLTGN